MPNRMDLWNVLATFISRRWKADNLFEARYPFRVLCCRMLSTFRLTALGCRFLSSHFMMVFSCVFKR